MSIIPPHKCDCEDTHNIGLKTCKICKSLCHCNNNDEVEKATLETDKEELEDFEEMFADDEDPRTFRANYCPYCGSTEMISSTTYDELHCRWVSNVICDKCKTQSYVIFIRSLNENAVP